MFEKYVKYEMKHEGLEVIVDFNRIVKKYYNSNS